LTCGIASSAGDRKSALRADASLPGTIDDVNDLVPAPRPLQKGLLKSSDSDSDVSVHERSNALTELEVLSKYVDKPSKLIVSYPERNAKDAAVQTKDKYIQPKRGGLTLPSEKVDPLAFLLAVNKTNEDEFDELEFSTIARAKQGGIKKSAPEDDAGSHKGSSLHGSLAELHNRQRQRHQLEIDNKRAKMSKFKRIRYDFTKWVHRKEREFSKPIGLWNGYLKFVESRFGAGIASYFSLYRWMFLLNVFFALLWGVFVITFGIVQMGNQNAWGWETFRRAHENDNTSATWSIPATRPNDTSTLLPDKSIKGAILVQELFSGKVRQL
jgi:hypothetical protein